MQRFPQSTDVFYTLYSEILLQLGCRQLLKGIKIHGEKQLGSKESKKKVPPVTVVNGLLETASHFL